MTLTIEPGDLITLDPSDKRVVLFDWDNRNLGDLVTISSSVFTITAIRQAGTALSKDNPSILAGSRKTQVRLDATTASNGDLYELANTITTNESPAQVKEQSIQVLIQNR